MEQLILLLIVGLFGLIKWLFENYGRFTAPPEREEDEPPTHRAGPPAAAGRVETDEEARVRRFMEALGLPTEGAPPPAPVHPPPMREAHQPAPRAQKPTSGLPTPPVARPHRHRDVPRPPVPVPLPHHSGQEGALAKPLLVALESESSRALQEEERRKEVAAFATVPEQSTERSSLLPALHGAAALRRAFILREVLGPPKAMQ